MQVVWRPYVDRGDDEPEVVRDERFLFDREIWLLCLSFVHRYSISRVTRQLGQRQGLPFPLLPLPPSMMIRGAPRDKVYADIYPEHVEDWRQGGTSIL